MTLEKETITDVIRFCNRDLVPDPDFRPADQFHNDTAVETQLGDSFYQARFMYKLMSALRLPLAK